MTRVLRLTPTFFHLLLCLTERPKHGYGMMMEEAGLIRETEVADAEQEVHGERRRYYALTAAGRRRLESELRALKHVLAHARERFVEG